MKGATPTSGEKTRSAAIRQAESHVLFKESVEITKDTVRFSSVANGIGAVTTIGLIGALASEGAAFKILLVPLSCFAAGAIFAGFSIFSMAYHLERIALAKAGKPPAPKVPWLRWINWTSEPLNLWTYGTFLLFILGVITGLIILMFA